MDKSKFNAAITEKIGFSEPQKTAESPNESAKAIDYIDATGQIRSLDKLPEKFLYLYLSDRPSAKIRDLIVNGKRHWHKFKYANSDAWVIDLVRQLQGEKPFPAYSFAQLAGDYSLKHTDPYYSQYSQFHYRRDRSPKRFDASKLPLRSLFGAPVEVEIMLLIETELPDLRGTLEAVTREMRLSSTKMLTSLKGCPKIGLTAAEVAQLEFQPPEYDDNLTEEGNAKRKKLMQESWESRKRGRLWVNRTGLESFDGIHPDFDGTIIAHSAPIKSLNALPERLYSLEISHHSSHIEPLNHRLYIDHWLNCDRDQLEAIIDQLELGPEATVRVNSRKAGSESINVTPEVMDYIRERNR